MWRIWTRGWGPKAWWHWWHREGFPLWVAFRLPPRIAYWAFIRVYAHSTTDGLLPGPEFEMVAKLWAAKYGERQ